MTDWLAWILCALGVGHHRPSAYALASDPIMMCCSYPSGPRRR